MLLPALALAAETVRLPPAATRTVDFEKDVRPILAASCLECHGPMKQRSDFRVDVKAIVFAGGAGGQPTVVPGKSADSPLIHYVAGLDEEMQMPPTGKGDALTAEQIGVLRAWIDQGAIWPAHATATVEVNAEVWSLRPIRQPAVPTAKIKNGNVIDSFLAAKRADKNLPASSEADRRTLLRRAAITLTGLPPTPEETAAFIHDSDPSAYDKLVDRLLASPRFGERWAQFWLDVVRWSETNGSESNLYRKNAWPYRDYVIRAFNADLPFDRFIREQIAGDALGVDEATGFLVSGGFVHSATVGREESAIRQARADRLDETIQSISASLLGVTMACARCHNHKFDPIPQKDYYALAAVFQGLEYGHRPWRNMPDAATRAPRADALLKQLNVVRAELLTVTPSWTEEWPDHQQTRFAPVRARAVRLTFPAQPNSIIEELLIFGETTGEKNLALASGGARARSFKKEEALMREITNVNDGKFGQTFAWRTREAGDEIDPQAPPPWLEIELPAEVAIDRIVLSSDREALVHTDYLIEPGRATASGPRKYRVEVRGSNDAWSEVANVELPARAVAGVRDAKNAAPTAPQNEAARALLARLQGLLDDYTAALPQPVFAGYFIPPVKTHLFGRGDPMAPRDEVFPNALTALKSDLKLTSESPDQERRLAFADWLTDPLRNPLTPRVLANRLWLHVFGHGIVDTPGDFGQAGAPPSHPELLDWLASEFVAGGWSAKKAIRLLVTSAAFRQSSAPNTTAAEIDADARLLWRFPPRRVEAEVLRDAALAVAGTLDLTMGGPGFRIHADKKRYGGWQVVDNAGPGTWRRMIYQENMRGIDDRMFTAFDRPECGQVTPKRTVSTTPLQALNLFNGDFVLTQADKLAARVQREAGADTGAQIMRVFALVFGRAPTATEFTAAAAVTAADRLPALCRVLLNANEFAFIE